MRTLSLCWLLLCSPLLIAGESGSVNGFYGSFATEVPLALPAFHGLEPDLKLSYHSGGGPTWIGHGWSLTGLSFIERATPGGGAPLYNSSDGFYLDGTELLPDTSRGGTHATRILNYARITYEASANRWVVLGTNGNRAEYSTRFDTSKGTFRWYLSSVRDPRGNTLTYSYQNDGSYDLYPHILSYNGNQVRFYLENRADVISFATGAGLAQTRKRLKTIAVSVGGQYARAYKLTHTSETITGNSQLASVTQYGRDVTINSSGTITGGSALPGSSFVWRGGSSGYVSAKTYNSPTTDGYGGSWKTVPADVNGDGKTDMVAYFIGSSSSSGIRIQPFIANGSGGYTKGPYNTPSSSGYSSSWQMVPADVNGDGMMDMVAYFIGSSSSSGIRIQAFLSDGTGRFNASTYNSPATSGYSSVWKMVPADVDGDGNTDMVAYFIGSSSNSGIRIQPFFSNGAGQFTAGSYNSPATSGYGSAWKMMPADVNGDGKSDMVATFIGSSSSSGIRIQAFISNGNGGYTNGPYVTPASSGYGSVWKMDRGDFNGDGKTDMVAHFIGSSSSSGIRIQTFLSNGAGGFETRAYNSPATSGYSSSWRLQPADANGDGKTDMVATFIGSSSSSGVRIQPFFSKGDGTFRNGPYNSPSTSGYATGWDLYRSDPDGDGKIDMVAGFIGHGSGIRYQDMPFSGDVPNYMGTVNNGTGGTTSITYSPSSNWNNTYLPTGFVAHTITGVTTSDGRGNSSTTNYTYEGGLWSKEDRRFLGFRKVTSVLDAQGNYTETWYYQKVGSLSKPEYTYFKDNAGRIFKYSAYTYTENTSPPYSSLLTSRWDYELNLGTVARRSLVQFTYDVYGNVVNVYAHGDYDISGDEKTVRRGYVPNTSSYLVGLPAYENTYEGIGTGGSLMRQSLYHYDNNTSYNSAPSKGLLTRVRKWDSTSGGYTSAQMTYDTYGNIVAQTDERGSITTTQFDSTYHVYPVSATNSEGHSTTSTYDYVLGLETANTDANGASTYFGYDIFGRPTSVTWPDGSATSYSYLSWGNPSSQRIVEYQPDGSGNGLWKATWQDGLGRIWKTQKEGGATRETIYSGATDRVWKRSLPYTSGETPRWVVTSYDGLGRPRTVTHADGSYSENVYANDSNGKPYTAIYDENGNEKLHWADTQGKLTRIREKNGSAYYYTNYQYDVLDRLTRVVDHDGNATTVTWDSLGRKRTTQDPDTGLHTYEYDDGGLPIRETDAAGRVTTFSYDNLGRMISRTNSDGDRFDWYYDQAGHGAGIGRLTSTSFPNGSTEHTWDVRGNEVSTTRCFQGNCRTLDTFFDSMGRVEEVTYPDGETVTYTYDNSGQLATMPGYVDDFQWDAGGQLTSMTYANGTVSNFNYDGDRRTMLQSTVTGGNGSQLFHASYNYDAGARVTGSQSNTHHLLNLTYSYDGLNRLAAVGGSQSQSLSYSPSGGITYNSKLGNYKHGDSNHKHAVTQAGARNLSYDVHGNLLSDGARNFQWNADNLLDSVQAQGQTSWFHYDASGLRIHKSGPDGDIFYFNALLEEVNNVDVKYYMAGPVLVAKQSGGTKTWFHADRLGSIRLMTDSHGKAVQHYGYDAWGSVVESIGNAANERGFTGHYSDTHSGLVYMNARYYDAELGRFISPDSVVPEPGNSQALDRYAYAYNNPINNTDPTGHAPVVAALAVVASSVAAVSAGASTWLAVTAVVGAGLSIAGYYTKDPLLSTIGGVMLGFAGGFAATGLISQGILGASVAAATSPMSPLGDGVKKAIGWAYTAYGLFRGSNAEFKSGQLEAPQGYQANKIGELYDGRVTVYRGVGPYKAIYEVTGVTTGDQPTIFGRLGANIRDIGTNLRGGLTPSANAILDHMSTNGYLPSEVLGIGHSLGSWDLIQLANNGHMTNVIGFGVPHEALIQVVHGTPNPGLNMTLAVGWADYVSLPRAPMVMGSAFGAAMAKAGGTNGLSFGVLNTGFGIGAHMQENYFEASPALFGR